MKPVVPGQERLLKQLPKKLRPSQLRGVVRNAAPNLAERVLSNPWMEKQVLWPRYQTYLNQHQTKMRTLSDADQSVVENLSNSGHYITTLTKLSIPEQNCFFQAGEQLFKSLEQSRHHHQVKFQITPDFPLLKSHLKIFQWGLVDRLLAIAENYIRLPVAYDTCLCNISVNNGLETATRRWHLDNEDRRVLKIIIYFNDVETDGGPFQFLDLESSQQVLAAAVDRCAFFSGQEFNTLVQSQTPSVLPQTCTGAAGTVIFVDTAKVYHRGYPPTMYSRRAITFGYCSRRPQRPFRCGRNQLSRSQLTELAVGLTDAQKSCLFWQDDLPAWIRRIPTYSYG